MTKFSKAQFLRSCGGLSPLKIRLENRETGSINTFVFEQPFILIGQHPAADIRLMHPSVGTRHIYFQLLDGHMFGLQLSNRSTLNWSGKANAWGWIAPDDRLQFGPFTLSIVDGLAPSAGGTVPPNPLMSSPNGIAPVVLEYRSDVVRPFRGHVNRALSLLGSSSACKFRIQSARVSSIHCGLVRAVDGIWAVDLGGNGGIGVNGVGSRVARLEEDDLFELGGVQFHVHYEMPQAESPPVEPAAEPESIFNVPPLTPLEEQKTSVSSFVLARPSNVPTTDDRETFERMLGPVLEHFTAFQNQTFQQFQDLLNNMIHLMGSMFREQLDSVREELSRFDQLSDELAKVQKGLTSFPDALPVEFPEALAADLVQTDAPAKAKIPPPEPRTEASGDGTDANLHLWLQSRITELNEQRTNLWRRLINMIRGKPDST
jgi:FHA domain